MPEGVEVRIVADRLVKWLVNEEIESITFSEVWKHKIESTQLEFPMLVKGIETRGKYILISLASGDYLVSHLGMSGQWYSDSELHEDDKHIHIRLKLKGREVVYWDPRRFGRFGLNSDLPKLGIDIMSKEYTWKGFEQMIKLFENKRSNKSICELLLDQTFLAGVGNYIRADALYLARVDPFKSYKELTQAEWQRLYKGIRQVAKESYRSQGTTIAAYTGGEYITKVYGQQESPKGEPVLSRKFKGRTMYYCANKN
ncbi:MAG: hypothetical protein EBU90_08000 [Proteobacteria bacterium]|nr:hypothetical protein [Pseudomonadota bacterium]NBP15101.1 hypothetical protein [bacterium]